MPMIPVGGFSQDPHGEFIANDPEFHSISTRTPLAILVNWSVA